MIKLEVRKNLKLIMATLILCNFLAVIVTAGGNPPLIETVSRHYMLEGETISFVVSAVDMEDDPISFGLVTRPSGAKFRDNGDGTALFEWTPDYSGPNSSEGSPFSLSIVASDGVSSSLVSTEVVVINNNRSPQIVVPDTISVASGELIEFTVDGYDPDNDALFWGLANQPTGMKIGRSSPTTISWATTYADSGLHTAMITVYDQNGSADTAEVVMDVAQTTVYELTIDTLSAYPGEFVSIGVNLMNLEPVSGVDLVINYDVTVLTFTSLSLNGTRLEDWEYFVYKLNDRSILGDLRITGMADLNNDIVTDFMPAGDGSLVDISFLVSSNLQYAGQNIPIKYVFRDGTLANDNTMSDSAEEKISQEMILYNDGYVTIMNSDIESIGDINLNGVTYEIGDAIYFTNHFVQPVQYPMSPVQVLNSDVNGDGYGVTIADLVYLINKILNITGGTNKLGLPSKEIEILVDNNQYSPSVKYNSDIELGGISAVLNTTGKYTGNLKLSDELNLAGVDLTYSVEENKIRLVISSEHAFRIPSTDSEPSSLFELEGAERFDIEEIQVSSIDGVLIETALKNGDNLLPGQFKLYQNRPNPFNPTTEIRFDLPRAEHVELTVYNLLGREVVKLGGETMTAGAHTLIWDGRDNFGQTAASGIYFYRLSAGQYTDKKKMILLK